METILQLSPFISWENIVNTWVGPPILLKLNISSINYLNNLIENHWPSYLDHSKGPKSHETCFKVHILWNDEYFTFGNNAITFYFQSFVGHGNHHIFEVVYILNPDSPQASIWSLIFMLRCAYIFFPSSLHHRNFTILKEVLLATYKSGWRILHQNQTIN